jgi:hypothetical protein
VRLAAQLAVAVACLDLFCTRCNFANHSVNSFGSLLFFYYIKQIKNSAQIYIRYRQIEDKQEQKEKNRKEIKDDRRAGHYDDDDDEL